MNERSPLLVNSINTDGELPLFVANSGRKNFTFVLPSLEDEKTYKDRFFSIRMCYIVMFISSVSFTVCISSMWPFLQIIDIATDTVFFGWIVAGFSLGQLIASPLFGYWAVKTLNHKIPILVCLFLTCFANILYAYLQSIDTGDKFTPKYWMLLSRFIMGVGASCAAVVRSYVSGATNLEERTVVLANISAMQGLGFIIGPVLQAALVPLHYPGFIEKTGLHLNMYTSPAFISALIYVTLITIIIIKFNEYIMINKDTEKLFHKSNSEASINSNSYSEVLNNLPPPDRIAIYSTLALFFICCFVFSFYETLSSPLTIDMYAWTKAQATLYNGIILGGFGILAVFVVLFTKFLAKKYQEKLVMSCGYVLLFVAVVSLLPWGHDYPSVEIPTIAPGHRNFTDAPQNTTSSNQPAPRGCPLDYDWCYHILVEYMEI